MLLLVPRTEKKKLHATLPHGIVICQVKVRTERSMPNKPLIVKQDMLETKIKILEIEITYTHFILKNRVVLNSDMVSKT
jgi:hypothetical protein